MKKAIVILFVLLSFVVTTGFYFGQESMMGFSKDPGGSVPATYENLSIDSVALTIDGANLATQQ